MNRDFTRIFMNNMNHPYGNYILSAATASFAKQHSQQYLPTPPISAPTSILISDPTCFDVINGRGQGVHKHPGNEKYRSLVLLNKGLYAKCPKTDKSKVSKGVVAAIRELGGRFLELDEKYGAYYDIGDKKACAKTSQALREGQTKIRQEMYSGTTGQSGHDTSLLASFGHNPTRAVSAEGYFGYSVQLLESLHNPDQSMSSEPAPLSPIALPSSSLGSKDSDEANPAKRPSLQHEETPKQDSQENHKGSDDFLDFVKRASQVTAI